VTTIISIIVLTLIGWLEMFSNASLLQGVLPPLNEFIVPLLILYSAFLANSYLHKKHVQEDDPYSSAHATLSAVFPAR
jgi:hypothetical protein